MRIVGIGAAPTTLGFAYRLAELQRAEAEEEREGNGEKPAAEQQDKSKAPAAANDVELLIFEQNPFPGGLSCTLADDRGFLWDMGGHITFSHNFPYYERATREAVGEWNSLERNCMVDMNYLYGERGIHLVPYPAQFAVPLFPDEVKRRCLADLKERYEEQGEGQGAKTPPATFEEWILEHFGPAILDHFFRPYTRKVWTTDCAKMSPGWVGTRVAKLPQEKLESLCAMSKEELAKADFGWGPNARFQFPKYGGTGAVWKQLAEKLPARWIQYNAKVVDVDWRAKTVGYRVEGSDEVQRVAYDALINSSPIDGLVLQTGICAPLNIDHNKVFVVGVGLEQPMTEFCRGFTWLYFPDPAVPFYRVTMFSRYGEVTPDSERYWSVMCECARPHDDPITEEEIRERAVEGLCVKGIIRREQVTTTWSITLPYGYPIPSIERDAELARAHTALEANGIYSRGRFGGWKYEVSNQDHCFIQGRELADRLVLGQPEKLYKTGVHHGQRG